MAEKVAEVVRTWLDDIQSAKRREKEYHKEGAKLLKIYNGEMVDQIPFNILFSNTETLIPALFTQNPRPIVKRRFNDDDPIGMHASKACQRVIEYMLDTNIEGYETFATSMKFSVLDGLLPGRGVTSIKYDADISGEEDDESVKWESVCTDSRKWNRVYFGYADKWEKVPWIAYEDYIDEDEAAELFDKKVVNKIKFTDSAREDDEDDVNEDDRDKGSLKTALVYTIWDKSDKKVKYISPHYTDGYLKEVDDPLGITGFFNCPKPLMFVEKANDLMPTPVYRLYKNQAKELNNVTRRLNRVISAIKVRGVYNGLLGDDLEKILSEDDNALVPTDNAASLMEGGLDKNIWFMPLSELIGVAQVLIQSRESIKQVIYEITGISDIIRGQSKASETLGAQQIKESWGTMRLKRSQVRVQEYARDTIRIMLDVAIQKFSEKTWAKITGLPYLTSDQQEELKDQVKAFQKAQQPLPPELEQAMNTPAWPQILDAIKDDFARSYRVDIETNSTLDAEATEDKQLVGEFMNAMAQFMNGIMPMVQQKIMPFGVMKSMFLQVSRRFRFGEDVEEQINGMQEPQQQQDPEQQKAMEEFKKAQEQFQQQQQQFKEKETTFNENVMKKSNEIAMKEMQFEFDKKLAEEQQKARELIATVKQDADQVEAESRLKEMIGEHQRNVQSMMDKHAANVCKMQDSMKEMIMQRPESESVEKEEKGVTVVNQMPNGDKSINILRDETGMISGAEVTDGQ